MAQAKVVNFSTFLVLVGNGASPEVFAAPCGLTSRGFNRTAETNDTNVPDCDDEDKPSWLARDVVSLAGEISGSGVLDTDALEVWDDWFQSGLAKNCRVMLDVPVAQNGRHWSGKFILSSFNITAERGSKVTIEVTLTSDGAITKTDASA